MRKRTHAREITLQALYQFDLHRQIDPSATFTADEYDEFITSSTGDPEVREYARRLLDGILAEVDELDAKIAAVSENWRLNRTAAVDRCALRIGLYELLESAEVPPKVAINEAIELAKKFSAEQSGAFVNGILDRIFEESRASTEAGISAPPGEEVYEEPGDKSDAQEKRDLGEMSDSEISGTAPRP